MTLILARVEVVERAEVRPARRQRYDKIRCDDKIGRGR
jgi:hypothetical protein